MNIGTSPVKDAYLALLKPCPFCGSSNLRTSKLPKISEDYITFKMLDAFVTCLDCGADGPKTAFVQDVVEAWNKRIS